MKFLLLKFLQKVKITMKKLQAIEIITKAAKIYDEQINNKNLLIIFGNPTTPSIVETQALPRNFLHLTEVKLNKKVENNSPERFFQKAISHKINEEDFDFKDKTTEQKLNVLILTLRIASNTKMIGNYNHNSNHIKLQTDKLAGSVRSCIGLVHVGNYFVPNTILESDIRNDVNTTQKVLTILSRNINDKKYSTVEMTAKKLI